MGKILDWFKKILYWFERVFKKVVYWFKKILYWFGRVFKKVVYWFEKVFKKVVYWFKKIHLWLLLALLLFGVSLLWFYMPFNWLSDFFPGIKPTEQFGDRFEAVNALFAGLAFAGVIFAIILQWKELGLQRKELKNTRAEIRGQKETLQKQNFESSFFQLLGLHNGIVNSMEILDKACSGKECFGYMLENLQGQIYRKVYPEVAQSSEDDSLQIERLNTQYEEFFRLHQSFLGPYFLHLYQVINFVGEHEFFDKDEKECKNKKKIEKNKKRYTDFILSQLSSNELGLLFFHGLNTRGTEFKFKNLVEEYAFFKYLSSEVLIVAEYRAQHGNDRNERLSDDSYKVYIQKLMDLYAPSAYGESD